MLKCPSLSSAARAVEVRAFNELPQDSFLLGMVAAIPGDNGRATHFNFYSSDGMNVATWHVTTKELHWHCSAEQPGGRPCFLAPGEFERKDISFWLDGSLSYSPVLVPA